MDDLTRDPDELLALRAEVVRRYLPVAARMSRRDDVLMTLVESLRSTRTRKYESLYTIASEVMRIRPLSIDVFRSRHLYAPCRDAFNVAGRFLSWTLNCPVLARKPRTSRIVRGFSANIRTTACRTLLWECCSRRTRPMMRTGNNDKIPAARICHAYTAPGTDGRRVRLHMDVFCCDVVAQAIRDGTETPHGGRHNIAFHLDRDAHPRGDHARAAGVSRASARCRTAWSSSSR